MLVRFFDHGKVKKGELTRTGGGGAVRNYLLFDKNDKTKLRTGARLIYGNDVDTTEIINGIKNSKIYTSGVLSFDPEEVITESQKIEIIESFEKNLFPGLMRGEYSGYWVEHQDKDRQELHFVFADIHLPSGKALPVFYHGKDLKLVDSWKDLINIDYGLADPNDPQRQRAYRLKGYEYNQQKQQEMDAQANVAAQKEKKVFIEEEIALHLIEAIANDESIQTQADVIELIGSMFEITRIAKDGKSISIKNPDGGRNIKLKGMIYERDFKRENLANLGREQTKKPTNRSELQAINQRERDKRQHRLEQRFAKHRGADRQLEQQLGREFNEAQSRATATSPEPAQSINGQSERAEPSSQPYERIGVTDSDNLPDQRERQSQEYDAKRGGGKQNSGQSEQNRFTNHSARNDDHQPAGHHGYQESSERASATHEVSKQIGNASDTVYPVRDFSRYRFVWVQLLSGQSGVSNPATLGYTTSPYQSNPLRGSSLVDGESLHQSGQRGWGVDYTKEPTNSVLGQQPARGEDVTGHRTAPHQKDNATEESQPIAVEAIQDESDHPHRAHYQAFSNVVKRFASENRPQAKSSQRRVTRPAQSSDFTVSDDTVTAVINQVIDPSRPADTSQDPTAQSADRNLLRRIGKATEIRDSNTEKRTRRISALTNQDTISLEPIREHTQRRRQRTRKVADRFKDFDSDITDQYRREQQRAARLRKYRRRINNVKDELANESYRIDQATTGLGQVAVAVSAVVKAVIELFKKLFNGVKQQVVGYAKEGLLYHANADGSMGRQATTKEAEVFVGSHPYDLSGYAQLRLTAKKLEKDKELRHEPFRSFGR
nr:relaxase/mobilization nuclease domain-containing protein [Moraxella osloensis]